MSRQASHLLCLHVAAAATAPKLMLMAAAEPKPNPRPSLAAAREFLAAGQEHTMAKPVIDDNILEEQPQESIPDEAVKETAPEDDVAEAKPPKKNHRRAKIRGQLLFEEG